MSVYFKSETISRQRLVKVVRRFAGQVTLGLNANYTSKRYEAVQEDTSDTQEEMCVKQR